MELEFQTLWAALVAYVLAGSLAIIGVVLNKRPERWILFGLWIGLVLHTASIAIRWERVGHGPYVTMYEILSSNIWGLLLAFAIAYTRIPKVRPISAVVMPILFVLMGWMLMTDPTPGTLPRTFHTVWLVIHIGFAKVFLGSTLVAVGIAGVILARDTGFGQRKFVGLPDNRRLDELAFRCMGLGLIFDSLMLVAGAIWAQDAWGRYWDWDMLETWSFVTWLALALYMHGRLAFKLSPRTNALAILTVFALAFLTFFGIPFLSKAPHKGTFG